VAVGAFLDPSPVREPKRDTFSLIGGEPWGGWVRLSMMVDSHGKPFDVGIEQSSGNKSLERYFVGAWQRVKFKPATVNGEPVESVYETTQVVGVFERGVGARPDMQQAFVSAYEALQTAIGAKDRAAADAAMKRMKVTTLYEDAIYGLAQFQYTTVWGGDPHQLADVLSRALIDDALLPTSERKVLLLGDIHVQLQLHDYFQVLYLWDRLQKVGVDQATAAKITPAIEQIKQLRAGPGTYAMSDSIGKKGSWWVHLFKKTFALAVSSGDVSQLKLKCKGKYVQFPFDQKLEYKVPEEVGDCLLDIEGTPGTQFELTQS
jgi:TonB family protein